MPSVSLYHFNQLHVPQSTKRINKARDKSQFGCGTWVREMKKKLKFEKAALIMRNLTSRDLHNTLQTYSLSITCNVCFMRR